MFFVTLAPSSLLFGRVVSEKMGSPTVYFLMVTLPERGYGDWRTIAIGIVGNSILCNSVSI